MDWGGLTKHRSPSFRALRFSVDFLVAKGITRHNASVNLMRYLQAFSISALSLAVLCMAGFYASHAIADSKRADSPSGFDVSHFNGEIDWKRVSSTGTDFVVFKATEGIDWLDPTFSEHWKAAKTHGIIRGAYHFFVAHDDPMQEALWYIKNVALESGDLPPIIDVERAKKTETAGLSNKIRAFVSTIEKHYGTKPIIYTGPNFWNSHVKDGFNQHHLWIADYAVPQPVLPGGWKKWTFWQFTQQAELEGVEKPVDMNRFSGTHEDLQRILLKR